MSAIKKFFQKKKMDIKFKKAGGGHKLTDETRSSGQGPSRQPEYVRVESTESARRAGEAALSRLDVTPRPGTAGGMSSIKVQARRQLEAEKKAIEQAEAQQAAMSSPREVMLEAAPVTSANGVLYKCPMAGPAVLPRSEMEGYIETFLLGQLAEEPEMAAALMIHTFNKDQEKVKVCIETISKYLDNIIGNSGEEKFRKIRIGNKTFQERVAALKGTEEFIQSVGFVHKRLPFQEGEDDFYVLGDEQASNIERLKEMKEILNDAEPIRPELDHSLKVFHPSSRATQFDLPNEFYNITPEEIKREQQARTEAVEKLGMLRTKEMRERDKQRALRRYRYTLLRIRLPDGLLLQGTFRAMDKLSSVLAVIREALISEWMPFTLNTSTGQRLTDEESRLAELELVPAAVLNLAFDPTILAEVNAQQGSVNNGSILKQELMACIQSL